jgi:hypothetical protein
VEGAREIGRSTIENVDLQQRTDDLNNKFQKVSSPFEEILKNAPPGSRKVHASTLLSLARATMTNYDITVQAYRAEHIQQIAWATRNLLELSVWSEYCAKSSDNADRFSTDALRDGIGMFQAMESLFSLAPNNSTTLATSKAQIAAAKQQLAVTARMIGISKLDHRYKDVRKVVRELGGSRSAAYKHGTALLSKFVHPTALIVTTVLDPAPMKLLIQGFFEIAVGFANGILNEIARASL